MKSIKKVYISLGSNKGDKFKNLQMALNDIYESIGNIKMISKVYQSPAYGFEGQEFFNACAILETSLTASRTMKELLKIEKRLGRIRTSKKEYEIVGIYV